MFGKAPRAFFHIGAVFTCQYVEFESDQHKAMQPPQAPESMPKNCTSTQRPGMKFSGFVNEGNFQSWPCASGGVAGCFLVGALVEHREGVRWHGDWPCTHVLARVALACWRGGNRSMWCRSSPSFFELQHSEALIWNAAR